MGLGYVRAMSSTDRASSQAGHALPVPSTRGNASKRTLEAAGRVSLIARLGARWSAPALGAAAATTTFIALTCWWLTQDRSIPVYDAGDQLETALIYHNMLQGGNLLGPFTYHNIYPILGHMVGAIAALVGGVNVASPIIGENLVFVPLLALGCYQTGRLLFSPLAGMLAVVFVLGSPLIISLFHVFMLDAPLAALVALSVWLILASEDFSRPGTAALAGLACGLGINLKVQFGLFVVGLILIVLLHGGWRNWRGFAIFAVVGLVVGLPWYIVHLSELGEMFELAGGGPGTPPGNIPPRFSFDNLTWYFWNVLNSQLLAVLFLFAIVGTVWTTVTVVRDHGRQRSARLEFLLAGFAAWLVITFGTIHHDIRYGLPLLAFLSVLATGWIAALPRKACLAASAVLVLGVAANTLGITFGVGREVKVALVNPLPSGEQAPDEIVAYSTTGFLVSAPSRDGDVPGLLEELRRNGVRAITWGVEQSELPDFSFEGLLPLARIAKLSAEITQSPEFSASPSVATLVHRGVSATAPPPCARLSDGTGVWVVRHDPTAGKPAFYCPTRQPQFYDPGAVG
jgi:4-amino-4-deoxy-L-arabinose transferase-like glycosyltransferase